MSRAFPAGGSPWKEVLLLMAALGAAWAPCPAQEARPAGPAVSRSVGNLGWMHGIWTGESEGTFMEEHWTEPRGGNMTGMFRVVAEGKAVFYELMSLDQEGAEVWLRIKHFGPELVGREEREKSTVLKLTRLDKEEALFDNGDPGNRVRLLYRREGADGLYARLEKGPEGKTTTEEFRMSRRREPALK